ncbi:MAG: hypothetical protein KDA41_07010 [Planctomycetales bacterium]|nr:hypothetical protein [Planctomycetales bacterium]
MKRFFACAVGLALLSTGASVAHAGPFAHSHFLGRVLGLGWSDGYHARCTEFNQCDPACAGTMMEPAMMQPAPDLHGPPTPGEAQPANAIPVPTLDPYYHPSAPEISG